MREPVHTTDDVAIYGDGLVIDLTDREERPVSKPNIPAAADPEWTVDVTYRVQVGPAPGNVEAIELAKNAILAALTHPTLADDVHVWMRDLHVWSGDPYDPADLRHPPHPGETPA